MQQDRRRAFFEAYRDYVSKTGLRGAERHPGGCVLGVRMGEKNNSYQTALGDVETRVRMMEPHDGEFMFWELYAERAKPTPVVEIGGRWVWDGKKQNCLGETTLRVSPMRKARVEVEGPQDFGQVWDTLFEYAAGVQANGREVHWCLVVDADVDRFLAGAVTGIVMAVGQELGLGVCVEMVDGSQ